MKFPSIGVNFAMTKDAALKYADLLKAKAEQLPDEHSSNLITASSLEGVERLAEANQKFRG